MVYKQRCSNWDIFEQFRRKTYKHWNSAKQMQQFTREERSALYNLGNDKNVVIKSADKGSAIVV